MFKTTEEFNNMNSTPVQIDLREKGDVSNLFDEAWALAFDLPRAVLFELTKGNVEDTQNFTKFNTLIQKLQGILDKLHKLPNDEYIFMLQNSLLGQGGDSMFETHINKIMMDFACLSPAYYSDKLVTQRWLIATLGEEQGNAEFRRRCALVKKLDYKREALEGAFDFFEACLDTKEHKVVRDCVPTPEDQLDLAVEVVVNTILYDKDFFGIKEHTYEEITQLLTDIDLVVMCMEADCKYYK